MSPYVQTKPTDYHVRVALVIEGGKLKPVWFELTDKPSRERIFIKEVCSIWNHMEGNAKVINFSVRDGANNFKLSLNTKEFTWELGISEMTDGLY
jgi:hypothetical protein